MTEAAGANLPVPESSGGLPAESVPEESYGPLGAIFATDQPWSSTITRNQLGWEPTHPSLLADLENIQP